MTVDEEHVVFMHDHIENAISVDANDGITQDDDGVVSLELDEQEKVTVENPPWTRAFDTDEFYVFRDVTVARPIKQNYLIDGDVVTLQKKREELMKSWTIDNSPWTLGHPSSGRVQHPNQVHGFWKNPSYDTDADDLNSDLYVPVDDSEAHDFIGENTDVSVGFSNRIQPANEDGLDGYQVDMMYDHIASVDEGRCPSEAGCGIHTALDVEPTDEEYEIAPSFTVDDGSVWFAEDYEEDGRYFAVSPSEGHGEPKYPINNCSDVEDAWKLRSHGDITISVSTLEDRIKAKARDLDCDVPSEDNDKKQTMTEDCDCNGDSNFDLDVADLTVDSLAERHDGVAELVNDYDKTKEMLDEKKETIQELQDENEDLKESLQEYRQDEAQELIESITDITDAWSEDELETELEEKGIERLEDIHNLAADAVETKQAGGVPDDSDDTGSDFSADSTGRLDLRSGVGNDVDDEKQYGGFGKAY